MHKLLQSLSRQQTTPWLRYSIAVSTILLVTLLRVVAPLDVAPFLVYLPLLFVLGVAFGSGPTFAAAALSLGFAAAFFMRGNAATTLSTGQVVALVEFAIVSAVMVLVCSSLRRAIIESEATLVALNRTNDSLTQSQVSLLAANEAAEAARAAAEAANRAKSSFLANMSHELRTPLSAIIGYAEMLSEEIEDGQPPADLAADMGKIESNARHLLGLINDVLDLSKVESGKMEAFAETFDIARLVREVATTVDALMARKRNRLEIRLAEPLGQMHSDVTRIRQILLNLLSNAAKFTEDGVVTLSASRERTGSGAEWLRLSVADTGIGMTGEQMDRLFQRFQQADASTTRKFGGTGLGLALTKAFAAMLGGDVTVQSVLGQGSTFTLMVPAELAIALPAADVSHDPGSAGTRDLILVVDDDEMQRDLMSRFLAKAGYAARTAADGVEGLALARSLHPRAILLDVTMPGLDGWAVLSALKADPSVAAIPVVMVTFMSEKALAYSLGAADYVMKPVDWSEMQHVLEQFREAEGDVLVVDDDPDARLRARRTLERNDWTVIEAANGREALDRVAHAKPLFILLDLDMPVMDGFEFLRTLREQPGHADIPVVVLTAADLSPAEARRLDGADQIFRKGEISLQDLAEKLHRLDRRDEIAA